MTKLGAGRFSCQVHPRAGCHACCCVIHHGVPPRVPAWTRRTIGHRAAGADRHVGAGEQRSRVSDVAPVRQGTGRCRVGKQFRLNFITTLRTCGRREPDRRGVNISAPRSRGPRPARRRRQARRPRGHRRRRRVVRARRRSGHRVRLAGAGPRRAARAGAARRRRSGAGGRARTRAPRTDDARDAGCGCRRWRESGSTWRRSRRR